MLAKPELPDALLHLLRLLVGEDGEAVIVEQVQRLLVRQAVDLFRSENVKRFKKNKTKEKKTIEKRFKLHSMTCDFVNRGILQASVQTNPPNIPLFRYRMFRSLSYRIFDSKSN